MKYLHNAPLYLAAVLLACLGLLSMVPAASANPAEDMAALKNFTLNEDYLHRWIAAKKEAKDKGISLGLMTPGQMASGSGAMPSLSEMVDKIDHTPGADDLLARHDMTSQQFVDGSVAILMGAMTVLTKQLGGSVSGPTLNQDNVDFVRDHMGEIKAYLRHR